MATKRHKAEKNQYNTNITKTTADIALTNVFEVTNTLPSGNNCTPVKKPIKGRQLKILLKAIDKSNTNLAKNNIFAGFVF